MHRVLSCVLMMILLLTACGGSGEESPENLAARIRGEYLNLARWTASMDVTADYGDRVFDFSVDASWEREGDTVLTITAPELVAGITARITGGEGWLEYDGASLSTGPIGGDGMSPLEAVPYLMEQVTAGYMARCTFRGEGEDCRLEVVCRDPEGVEGEGLECILCFHPDTHDLEGMEVCQDGFTVLTLRMTEFAKEMTEVETGNDANLG